MAAVKGSNDILQALENRHYVYIVLLEFNAAFVNGDHILLACYREAYGTTDRVADWRRYG